MPANKVNKRSFRTAVRHWKKACKEMEKSAGDSIELIGEVLDLDEEWREMGRRFELHMSECIESEDQL